MSECFSCVSNQGIKRISPGEQIYTGKYWVVEHSYPTGLLGWVVIVLKRHCEELHNLSKEEWIELANIQYMTINSLNTILNCEKEYCACFAEMEGFKHIHFHIVPKTKVYLNDNKGAKAFNYLKVDIANCIDESIIIDFCTKMKQLMK